MYICCRAIEQWIRAKYERKQFAMKGPMPDPDTLPGDGTPPAKVVLFALASISFSSKLTQSLGFSVGLTICFKTPSS